MWACVGFVMRGLEGRHCFHPATVLVHLVKCTRAAWRSGCRPPTPATVNSVTQSSLLSDGHSHSHRLEFFCCCDIVGKQWETDFFLDYCSISYPGNWHNLVSNWNASLCSSSVAKGPRPSQWETHTTVWHGLLPSHHTSGSHLWLAVLERSPGPLATEEQTRGCWPYSPHHCPLHHLHPLDTGNLFFVTYKLFYSSHKGADSNTRFIVWTCFLLKE